MIEIERKFLVKEFPGVTVYGARSFIQGYITESYEGTTVRVRMAGDKSALTIKGVANSSGLSRTEHEIPIEENKAFEMLNDLCQGRIIIKKRYQVQFHGHTWELDVFDRELKGLMLAEIELKSEDEEFELPPWIGEEVTGNPDYTNACLALGKKSRYWS